MVHPVAAARVHGNRRAARLVFLADQFSGTIVHQNMKITDHPLTNRSRSDIHLFLTHHFQPESSGQAFPHTRISNILLFRLAGTAHGHHCQQRAQHEQHKKHFPAERYGFLRRPVYSIFQ